MTDPILAALQAEREAIKQERRELHELLQECKEVRVKLAADIKKAREGVDKFIEDQVKLGLDEMMEQISNHIDIASEKVMTRFETLGEILLGEDRKSRKKNGASIPEIIDSIVADKGSE